MHPGIQTPGCIVLYAARFYAYGAKHFAPVYGVCHFLPGHLCSH